MSEQDNDIKTDAPHECTPPTPPTPPTPDPLDVALAGLKVAIKKLDPKPQQIITTWLTRWSSLLTREKGFSPEYLPYYKRGDIVYIDLGFNVGSEHGGVHYAVIYENGNSKRSNTAVVVPLSSVSAKENTSQSDIYLGENVIPWTPGVKTIAKPNQIRTISKMRILKPLHTGDNKARLSAAHMDAIDARLRALLLKPPPTATKK